mgnify:CR=1 FL=1
MGFEMSNRTPTLNAGRLRHRIQIVRTRPVQDDAGGFDLGNTVLFANRWASVEAVSGAENRAAGQEISTVLYAVVIRWIGPAPNWHPDTDYTTGQRVLDSNGNLQQAKSDGTSADTAPAPWANTPGDTTTETTGLPWLCLGPPLKLGTGVNADMQVIFKDRRFQIEAVLNPDGRNKMLRLICLEINDGA